MKFVKKCIANNILTTSIVIVVAILLVSITNAASTIFNVNWQSDFSGFTWVQTDACAGVGASCSTGRVNDTTVNHNVLFISGSVLLGSDTYAGYWNRQLTWEDMGVPNGASVTSVSAELDARLIGDTSGNDRVGIQLFDSANTTNIIVSDQPVITQTDVNLNWNNYAGGTVNVKPTYKYSDTSINIRLNHEITFGLLLGNVESRLDDLNFTITYFLPSLEQTDYRFYANQNSTDVGSPLAAENSPATLSDLEEQFRLRMLVNVNDADLFQSFGSYKLQYVDKGSGTCAVPSGGTPSTYTDVTTSTLIAYYHNAAVSDGTILTANANDPTNSVGSVDIQTYEELNNFTNSQSLVAVNNAGMWDFALTTNGANPGTSFCFRIVESDNDPLSTYTFYPQINTKTPVLAVDIVDASNVSVSSPSVGFGTVTQISPCQNSTATLGIINQKIRVTNITIQPSWTLTLAAQSGPTGLWTNGSSFYDFNDNGSGCLDATDSDSYGGQLTVSTSNVTLTPDSGCTSAGISFSSGSFVEGSTDSITLASASGSADPLCIWDITGIELTQTIPGGQAPGNYSMDMILTIVAN